MVKRQAKDSCTVCGRNTNNAFICRRCAAELHDLLVGSREPDGQPGVVWYARRLRESAYRQSRLSGGGRSSTSGYALLGNHRAANLLAQINGTLATWEAHCDRLSALHSDKRPRAHCGYPTREFERLEAHRARVIAAHVTLIRHHRPDAGKLHALLLGYATEAWRIINRPNDFCCGPCPNMITRTTEEQRILGTTQSPCGTMLYAEDGARVVVCSRCRAEHDVEALREQMKTQLSDMLFTRAELVNLMATRLNDRIPQPTFSKLLRDGRLQPRQTRYDDLGRPEYLFTYDDVCEARLKPVPAKKIRSA